MRQAVRRLRVVRWAIFPLFIAGWFLWATIHGSRPVHAGQSSANSERTIRLGAVAPGISLRAHFWGEESSCDLQGNDSVRVTVNDGKGEVESKWLHAADLDFYLTLRPRVAGQIYGECLLCFGHSRFRRSVQS